MAGEQAHWDAIYNARAEGELTWFEAVPQASLDFVDTYLQRGEAVIDVGGGAARLVDALLDAGYGPITVLDLSETALAISKQRLGTRADSVTWIEADVTTWQSKQVYALWHDRAVFHFLTRANDRVNYVRAMSEALQPGGIAIIATFADEGPEMCSGLPVVRYAPEELAREFDRLTPARFEPLAARRHQHLTPKGNRQNFQFSVFRKKD